MKLFMSVGVAYALFGAAAVMAAPSISSSATGVSAQITAAAVVKANATVASASGSSPGYYDNVTNVAGINQNFLLVDGILIDAYQSLNADIITSRAFSNSSSVSATGTSSIVDAGASLFTRLLGIDTLSLNLAADVIGSTTTVGVNESGLFALGSSSLVNFTFGGSLFNSLNLNAGLFFNPNPNTVVLSLAGLSLILNEQIQTGNGIDALSMETNALRLSFKDYLYDGRLLNGNVILGHSQASITGYAPAVPEPATWAMLIGGFALVGFSMRRRKMAINFA